MLKHDTNMRAFQFSFDRLRSNHQNIANATGQLITGDHDVKIVWIAPRTPNL